MEVAEQDRGDADLAAALALGVGEGEMATVRLHQIPPQPACLSLTLPDTKKNDGQVFEAKK